MGIKVGQLIETILGVGIITDYHPSAKKIAVAVFGSYGQEWFDIDEVVLIEE